MKPIHTVIPFVAALFTGPCWAQQACEPGWVEMFSAGPYSTSADARWQLIGHDDGSGPALYTSVVDRQGDGAINDITAACSMRLGPFGWRLVKGPGGVLGGNALCVHDDGTGPALYGQATFKRGTATVVAVAKWTGADWVSIGEVTYGASTAKVMSSVSFDDGTGPALYVSGVFTSVEGTSTTNIARWNGTSWSAVPAFPGGFSSDPVTNLTVIPFGPAHGLYASKSIVVRKFDGAQWQNLSSGIWIGSSINSMAAFDFGTGAGPELVVGGSFSQFANVAVRHLGVWSGTKWRTWGGLGQNDIVSALAVLDTGSGSAMYVGGQFSGVGGIAAINGARFDGAGWTALNAPNFYPHSFTALGQAPHRAVYISGKDMILQKPAIRRLEGSSWESVGARGLPSKSSAAYVGLQYDEQGVKKLFVGGVFGSVAETPASCAARWDGARWAPMGAGLSATVYAATLHDDGVGPALFVGGDFLQADGLPAKYVARWTGSAWEATGTQITTQVRCLVSATIGGVQRLIAGTKNDGAFVWDGSSWARFGAAQSPITRLAVYDTGDGPKLYAGGYFTRVVNQTAQFFRVAVWDGSAWAPALLDPGSGMSIVGPLAVADLGQGPSLFVANLNVTSNGKALRALSRWDGHDWWPVGTWSLGSNDSIRALFAFDDGRGPALFVGGRFSAVNGGPPSTLGRWDGSQWSALGAGTPAGWDVSGLAAGHDVSGPVLFALGNIQTAGNLSAGGIGYWSNLGSWPRITHQPADPLAHLDRAAVFSVKAAGEAPFSYQWRKDGVPLSDDARISGSSTPALRIDNAGYADEGQYDVVVFNDCSELSSDRAALHVLCEADVNADTFVNGVDFDAFIEAFELGLPAADIDGSGWVNGVDFDTFTAAFVAGC